MDSENFVGDVEKQVGSEKEEALTNTITTTSRPIRKSRQCLKEVTNTFTKFDSENYCLTEVKKAAAPRKRAPAKRKSKGGKGRGGKRAKPAAAAGVSVSVPVATLPEDGNGAPQLEKFSELPPYNETEEESVGTNAEENDARLGPPILEKMVPDKVEAMEEESDSAKEHIDEKMSAMTISTTSPKLLQTVAVKPISPLRIMAKTSSSPRQKKKKTKGRNGNIYIGVANRILWLELQEQFGFENINNFGNFIMSYMRKVHEDFSILHQVAVDVGMFQPQGLVGFRWVNGLPHPVNAADDFIQLPEIQLSEEYYKRAFEVTYDLCVKRGKFLVDLASGNLNQPDANAEVEAEVEEDEDGFEESTESTSSIKSQTDNDVVKKNEVDTVLPTDCDLNNTETQEMAETSLATDPTTEQDSKNTDDETQTVSLTDSELSLTKMETEDEPVNTPSADFPTDVDEKNDEVILPASDLVQIETDDDKPEQDKVEDENDSKAVTTSKPKTEEIVESAVTSPEKDKPLMSNTDLQLQSEESVFLYINMEDDLEANKENIRPPTATKQVETAISQVDAKKAALRQILGDISLESICSPENFTPISTPVSKQLNKTK